MMTPAVFSLLALLLVIVLSMTARCHIGVLALGLAWPLAVWGADWKPDQVIGLFPSGLFLTLTGVTLLFGLAQENGTLGNVTRMATRWTRGRSELLPWMFFFPRRSGFQSGPGHDCRHRPGGTAGYGYGHLRRDPSLSDGPDGGQRCQRR